jgi:hypothetical protein
LGFVTPTVAGSVFAGMIAHEYIFCAAPVSSCHHSSRRLALSAFHA